ncbi:putative subunit of RNA polymerase [Hamiltosporidium tvaerminnensis]|uniref:Putative subunit of RNA polymerase n=2 Tax=Hamiltosporidium TaxID=1176354 RepID=A0A4Q9LEH0_9MICR|nr:DNA-directed RNA polymerases I, II, and III subunit RPABC2 [Hamiltosporidium tvaerminnensis]TBT97250.1 putative subunit of RNA polymerase [Hamiltosporidium magnivora]TBU06294.1 putative subunit of RNA polymerase [Hamiltosporidium magnivora]TBU17872.1 putative subunit of RNA polymerase [Hamiltosporidium tvaerminnensis]
MDSEELESLPSQESSYLENSELEIIEDKPTKTSNISPQSRITSPIMTKFERAHVLGVRALQLSMGASPMVDIEFETSPLKIAIKELKVKMIPFIVRRKLPDGSYEDWSIREMYVNEF